MVHRSTKKETDAAITVNPSPGAGRNTASVSEHSISDSQPSVNERFSVSEEEAENDRKAREFELYDPPKMVHRSTKLYPLPANQRALLL